MSFGKGLKRSKTSPPHKSRTSYLRERSVTDNKICHVIANPNEKTTPWLTLVLGTGCTTSRTQVEALARVVAALGKPAHAPDEIDATPAAQMVRSFTTDLIADRLRVSRVPVTLAVQQLGAAADGEATPGADAVAGARRPSWADWLGGLLLTAALVTKLYHRVKSSSDDAPRRRGHNDEAILDHTALVWGRLKAEYVEPCRSALHALAARVEEIAGVLGPPESVRDNLIGTIMDLLQRVKSGLTAEEVRVELADVHALAEFAWFCLTTVSSEPVYPGWSDLLLDLSNYDSPIGGRIGMPLFQSMTEAQQFILGRYQEVTRKSWARQVAFGTAEHESIHRAAADLLSAQSRHSRTYREAGNEVRRPPMTTAFITSFDLELELSLLRLGEPFSVVLPVHLLNKRHSMVYTCWIGLNVKAREDGAPHDRLAELLEPDEESYWILSDKPRLTVPVVVRLAGCPLIKLPDLARESPFKSRLVAKFETFLRVETGGDAADYEELVRSSLELQHAVIINEHDAMVQSEIDLIAVTDGNDAHRGLRHGLPAHFAAGNEHTSRFWMMLGVQIHDSAVRHRIATVISSLPHMVPAGRPPSPGALSPVDAQDQDGARHRKAAPKAAHRGLAVNRYSTEIEEDILLFWNGFEVVRDDVSVFAKDLRHYSDHLTQGKVFNQSGECNVS